MEEVKHYSHSELQKYKDCPLAYRYDYILRLQKIEDGQSEHHIRYGSAMHVALAHLYRGGTVQEAKKLFLENYPNQLDPEDNAKTQNNGITIIEKYAETKLSEDLSKWKILSIEQKEEFLYSGPFVVVLDMVAENKDYGGIYGFDHKIVGGKKATLSYDFWTQFNPNGQITKYTSFIKERFGDCSGFYINAIGVGFRKRAYKGEPAGFWYRFERQMFNRNNSQIELDKKNTAYWIERIKEDRERGFFGANDGNCKYCHYRTICESGWTWEDDEVLIKIQYEQKAPLESEKENLNDNGI